jgi:hypothetical protein
MEFGPSGKDSCGFKGSASRRSASFINMHKGWSAGLHHDNLIALSEMRPELRPLPAYSTLLC